MTPKPSQIPSRRDRIENTRLWPLVKRTRDYQEYIRWMYRGKRAPSPHLVKQRTILKYARELSAKSLIETGTYLGDMVFVMIPHFEALIPIELSEFLADRAAKRFVEIPKVRIIQGDSGNLLGTAISKAIDPIVFWLDGHYSGGITARADLDTPILNEIRAISEAKCGRMAILIDDARCFVGTDGYPTIEALREYSETALGPCDISVSDDIIRIVPLHS